MSAVCFDFWKMQGTGNDFVVVEPGEAAADWGAVAQAVCDRHLGVGADGLILVLPSATADRRMRMFNPDGSEAEMCGNGIRCFAKFALDRGAVQPVDGALRVETATGVLEVRPTLDDAGRVDRALVSMGVPAFAPAELGAAVEQAPPILELPLEAAGERLSLTLVSIGNPHAVQFVDRTPSEYELDRVGPAVERHPLFANRTNFEVVRVLDRTHIEMRVWERGAGETLACGSGACAAVVAARLRGLVDDSVEVTLPGGVLRVAWDGEGEVQLEGPAKRVFAGRWEGTA